MNEIAQRRNILNKISEQLVSQGDRLEKKSPEFQELMDILRDVDDNIRTETSDLKDYLKVAKTNFNRREYMTAVSYLGRFHDKVESIDKELSKLQKTTDSLHYQFLFGDDMDTEHSDYLIKHLAPKFETKKAASAIFEKEAGLTDWWHNITSDRGRTLAAWEKKFPKYAKDLKTQTNNMIGKSEAFHKNLLLTLKVLASYRSQSKLEEYLKLSFKWQENFQKYNTLFLNYYTSQVKRFIDYQKSMQALKDVSMSPGEEASLSAKPLFDAAKETLSPVIPKPVAPFMSNVVPSKPLDHSPMPWPKAPSPVIPATQFSPGQNENEMLDPHGKFKTLVSPVPAFDPVEPPKKKADHELFLRALGSISDQHPFVIAKEIIIYAKSIGKDDTEVSEQLLNIAKNILQK